MNDSFNIRLYKDTDSSGVKQLFREFVRYHVKCDPSFRKLKNHDSYFIKHVNEIIKGKRGVMYIAELDNEIVGYCLGMIESKPLIYESPVYGYIDNIAVIEKYQKRGIGEGLFNNIKKWFKCHNIDRIELFVASANVKSTSFWRKMGLKKYMEQLYIDL